MNPTVKRLLRGLRNGERAALAESITLVETSHPRKKLLAKELLTHVLKDAKTVLDKKGVKSLSFRLGLSGPPGAGKSTFIETFGKYLTSKGHRVAVLAVDPSSASTGGSLLGDKTRMPELTKDLKAYIRPSPARGHLGGVTRSTNEAIRLCEVAGYDVILVETVGVGQSEFSVVDMVDLFTLLIPPGGGDELQGLKRGIMEMSDLIIINKSDGDLIPAARRMQYEYMSALKYIRPKHTDWRTPVKRVSSLKREGIEELWELMTNYRSLNEKNGVYLERRKSQQKSWLWTHLNENMVNTFLNVPGVANELKKIEREVMNGLISPGDAADVLLEFFINSIKVK